MTKDEALRLALEALKAMQMYAAAEKKGLRICDEAIIAAEEVLAQPEQEPVGVVALDTSRPFVSGIHNGHVMPWSQVPNVKTVVMFKDLPLNTPLYDTPPQRKPLTRERLVAMADIPRGMQTFDDWVELFGRAIEQTHGIGKPA